MPKTQNRKPINNKRIKTQKEQEEEEEEQNESNQIQPKKGKRPTNHTMLNTPTDPQN